MTNTFYYQFVQSCVVILLGLSIFQEAKASDRRLAVLIANQEGWKGDPKLRYVLKGDLQPLAKELRRLGFEVKTLKNQEVNKVRKTFRWVQKRLKKSPYISTFLFYYSGHADKNFFHFGKRSRNPMHYKEFASFFRKLKVLRRIAIIDSCFSGEIIRQFGSLRQYKKQIQKGLPKGIRAHRPFNIKKLLFPNQGKEQGMRIISSSLHLAWELHRYKASTFTHHLLRGLRNAGDLNHDGKITIDELFDFTSREVAQETQQRPQQLILVKREKPYALAPAYHSRLWIGPKVIGELKVKIGNFLWRKRKRTRRPLRLAVVNGKGDVFLKQKQNCWKQAVRLPKGKEIRLHSKWTKVPCRKLTRLSKGALSLLGRRYLPPSAPGLSNTRIRFLGVSGGLIQSGANSMETSSLDLGVFGRWNHFGLGVTILTGQPSEKFFYLTRVFLEGELGWPLRFRLGPKWIFFPGVFAYGGWTFLHLEQEQSRGTLSLGGGAMLSFAYWWNLHFAVQLKGRLGVDYTPVQGITGLSLLWGFRFALLFAV